MTRFSRFFGLLVAMPMLAACSAPTPTTTPVPSPIPATATSVSSATPTTASPIPPSPTATAVSVESPRVVIGQVVIPVELSITDAQKAQGLSDRTSLTPGTGMLFVYQADATYGFWMRHMHFPLDLVWIGSSCTVVSLTLNAPAAPNTPENQLTIYQPSGPVRFVLEINAEEAAKFGIDPGDRVAFRGLGLESTPCFVP